MYKAFGNYVNRHAELRGVDPIFNNIEIIEEYPDENDTVKSLEHAACVHKSVRQHLQNRIRPNMKVIDIAKIIEYKTEQLSDQNRSINKGIGFPASLSLNDCAAHFHPKSNDNIRFGQNDIIKIDFGTETNGWIIDSAFTVCFNPAYDNLLLGVKEATNNGVKTIGVDMNISDWGAANKEIMESYEIKLNGEIIPVKAVGNLGGHNITRESIHGGTFLPCNNSNHSDKRFTEGVYAVETFGSTGGNYAYPKGVCTLYKTKEMVETSDLLLNKINNTFKTLPFTDRYIETFNINNYDNHLKLLVNQNHIREYPPVYVDNGLTAQYEHTVYISENKKKVFSKGEDY
jgi:methionyl aminopeptidase